MTQNQIDCFLCVCKTLNFTRAAAELHFTPQGVNKTISSLEKELGFPLFERDASAKSLRLTPAGQACMDSLTRTESELSRTLGEIHGYLRQLAGALRLGISEWIDPYSQDLCRALLAFHEEQPDLHMSAVYDSNDRLVDMLHEKQLDAIIVSESQMVLDRRFGVMPLGKEHMVLSAPARVCGDQGLDPYCWGLSYAICPVQKWASEESVPIIQKELAAMGLFPREIQTMPNLTSVQATMIFEECVTITDLRFGYIRRLPMLRHFEVPGLGDEARLSCVYSLRNENPRVAAFIRYMQQALGDYDSHWDANQYSGLEEQRVRGGEEIAFPAGRPSTT